MNDRPYYTPEQIVWIGIQTLYFVMQPNDIHRPNARELKFVLRAIEKRRRENNYVVFKVKKED